MLLTLAQKKTIYDVCTQLLNSTEKVPAKFAYGISMAVKTLTPSVKSLEDAEKQLTDYNASRIALCEKHSRRDVDGNAVHNNGKYDIIDMQAFSDDLLQIQQESTEYKELMSLLAVESEVEFHEIDINDFPREIEAWMVSVLSPLIQE
jgi:hypothetical protein